MSLSLSFRIERAATKRSADEGDGESEGPSKKRSANTGFGKIQLLSGKMAAFVGKDRMSRTEGSDIHSSFCTE